MAEVKGGGFFGGNFVFIIFLVLILLLFGDGCFS